MDSIKLKYEQLCNALDRLEETVENLKKYDPEDDFNFRIARDSLIQRFEFTAELFWKYLKKYLVEQTKRTVEFNTPKSTIRTACNAKIITEQDAEKMLDMIDDRNKSSHIYKEEIADRIAFRIESYYSLMRQYVAKLSP